MDPSTNKKSGGMAVVIAVVALVIGGLAGFGITKATDNNDTTSSTTMAATATTSKASDLRANLVALGQQHMIYTDQAVDAALDGDANADATGAALYKNGTDLGAAVGSVYGQDAETTFNKVWKLHLDEFVAYAKASAMGDSAGKQQALTTISTQYTKPLAQFLANANPNLPEATLESALADHIDMTAKMIDYHTAKNYTAEANELQMANQHMVDLMSTLAAGIAKQYPNKF